MRVHQSQQPELAPEYDILMEIKMMLYNGFRSDSYGRVLLRDALTDLRNARAHNEWRFRFSVHKSIQRNERRRTKELKA